MRLPVRGAVWLPLLALLVLLALPATAVAAPEPAGTDDAVEAETFDSSQARTCPEGPARLASWEPVEVTGGIATVAFVLATGCRDVDVSLVSYQVRGGGDQPAMLHHDTGRFSDGQVHRLTSVVANDCEFHVVFALGRPEEAERTAVETVMQAPDPCMYGAAPVVVHGPTVTTTPASSTTEPADQVATRTTEAPALAAADTTRPPATRAEPPATRPDAEPRDPATAGKAGRATAPAATTPTTTLARIATEPLAAVGPGPSGPLAGWDPAGLLGLAALLVVAVATLLLRGSRAGRPRGRHEAR